MGYKHFRDIIMWVGIIIHLYSSVHDASTIFYQYFSLGIELIIWSSVSQQPNSKTIAWTTAIQVFSRELGYIAGIYHYHTNDLFQDVLLAKARAGVKIRIMVWRHRFLSYLNRLLYLGEVTIEREVAVWIMIMYQLTVSRNYKRKLHKWELKSRFITLHLTWYRWDLG